ncbi:hypothetical protein A7A78_07895 [Aequorivita soesokkakensis]|uniref:Peptidase C14 caspase domain-containing protein n=1 Tax=Aequorivita soesokkakensis TaxID=1385699 RepID=A0A1A9LBK3_9FLAO|nr:caspase family protein [Aequorivita soesokkakensis]OAD90131.1 hypothetical protein A7A78_07895 [Aequorivita soesokkakensis]
MMDQDFALIIGINNYTPVENRGLRTLHGAINDANAFEKWVLDPKGGNIPEANCFKITSTETPLNPIQDQIDEAAVAILDEAVKNPEGCRRLYFYFAGHGLGVQFDEKNTALCLSKWSDTRRNTALSSSKYEDVLVRYGAFKEIIFLMDCCRNTKINVQPLQPTFDTSFSGDTVGATNVFTAYATLYQDQSFEVDVISNANPVDLTDVDSLTRAEKRGVFTKVLLEALQGGAADEQGIINADRLRDYLQQQIPPLANKHGYKQTPQIKHTFGANIPLFQLNVITGEVDCTIQIASSIKNEIELFSNKGLEKIFNPMDSETIAIKLLPGDYFIKEKDTSKVLLFKVLANGKDQNFKFL